MPMNTHRAAHPRHAELVEALRDYLTETGGSARWLGIVAASDPRLLSNLARGQHYPTDVLLALCWRMVAFYEAQVARETGQDN